MQATRAAVIRTALTARFPRRRRLHWVAVLRPAQTAIFVGGFLGRRTPTQTAWTQLREQATTRGLKPCVLLPAHGLQRPHRVAVLRSAAQTVLGDFLGRRTPTQTAWMLLREQPRACQPTARGLKQRAQLPAHSLQRLHWVAVLRSAAQKAVLVGFLGRQTQTQTTCTLLREQPRACKQCVLLPAHGLQPRNASTSCVTCPTWQVKKKLKLTWRMLGPHQQLHIVIALAWAMQLARRRIVVASRLLLPYSAVPQCSCTRITSISQVKTHMAWRRLKRERQRQHACG